MAKVTVDVRFVGLERLHNLMAGVGPRLPYAMAKALDEVGGKTRTRVIRAIVQQTGVPYRRVNSALSTRTAMGTGGGSFSIVARDVAISLKEFNPVKTKRGIRATAWRHRRLYPGSFFGPGGHVFVRKGASRLPIKKLWGPVIPNEMVRDEAEAQFYATVEEQLPGVLEKWLLRAMR